MKRLLPLLLAVIMILFLAACVGENNPNTNDAPQNSFTDGQQISSDTEKTNGTVDQKLSDSNPTDSNNIETEHSKQGRKILVAYFSATGTTKALAEYAADALGADIYEIVPREPYSSADLNYNDKNSRSTKEMNDSSCRPAINGGVADMEQYGIIFIGYPIWLAYHNLIQCTQA